MLVKNINPNTTRFHRWKAYHPNGTWRCFTTESSARKFATDKGVVVDTFAKKTGLLA